ncbi:uncharacterized protein LOC127723180 [Mytilus californianus]|uniref:uncharacterized protein LOC127723180 n=1 Tax=Mytilus californianus TaxID=6549 RepID=UPI0022467597|nr:uncharacterized protein LOC127723180 [Mytilus californianus]
MLLDFFLWMAMENQIKRGGHRNWSNVSSTKISSAHWPFRYCDIVEVETCEEIFGIELWDQIQAKNKLECINSWNRTQMVKSRQMISRCELNYGNSHDQARNLFNLLLLRHFEDSFISQQGVSLQPFEIYVAPDCYVEYKPQVDICLLDQTSDRTICFNIIKNCSKQNIEDSLYQTMFCTLSGCSSTAYCFVIKETFGGCFEVYVGKVKWPMEMVQMMMICGSDVSRQLGFNHHIHSRPIVAKYAYLGTIDTKTDDCPTVSLFLNTIYSLSSIDEPRFLPLTQSMQSVVDKRKTTHKHISKCICDREKVCNHKFEESSSFG